MWPRLCGSILIAAAANAQAPPVEFGAIAWRRDFAAASEQAAKTASPMLLLFQEVPG